MKFWFFFPCFPSYPSYNRYFMKWEHMKNYSLIRNIRVLEYYILHYIYLYIPLYYYITMKRITKSFRVNPELWTEVRVYVAKNNTDISSFIEQALKKELNKK